MSGVPYTFLMNTKLPISNVVTPALTVWKSLAFFTSTNDVAILSISKPLTYALPGLILSASKSLDAGKAPSVALPAVYAPILVLPLYICVTDSFIS